MKIKYLKIIFCFLLASAILQAVFAQIDNPRTMFTGDPISFSSGVIYIMFNPKDSLYWFDTTYRSKPLRDFFNSRDSTHVQNRVKSSKLNL